MPRTKKSEPSPAVRRTGNGSSATVTRKRPIAIPSALAHDAIAQRAYELFMQEGAMHGRDLEHWLRAEAEVLKGSALPKAS